MSARHMKLATSRVVAWLNKQWSGALREAASAVTAQVAPSFAPQAPVSHVRAGALSALENAIEWELLRTPAVVSISHIGSLEGDLGTLTARRDAEYGLVVTLETSLTADELKGLETVETGRLFEGLELKGNSTHSDQVRIPKAVIGSYSTTFGANNASKTICTIIASNLTRTFNTSKSHVAVVTADWYLSGPESTKRWPRRTEREFHERIVRTRVNEDPSRQHRFVRPPLNRRPNSSFSFDHLCLEETQTTRTLVSAIPKGFGPEWSRCLSVEFHHPPGQVPPTDASETVAEVLGFVFGRQLLSVGQTVYDVDGYLVEQSAIDPWGRDVIQTSSAVDFPPTRLGDDQLEAALQCVLQRYRQVRSLFALDSVLWSIWIARRMPGGFELPLYATALEQLMNAWFRSTKSKSKGVYMERTAFERVAGRAIAEVSQDLKNAPYADRIVRRMQGAYQMGVNERFEVFFDELGIPIGEHERAVIKARNVAAHGGTNGKTTREDAMRTICRARAYETLLNRCILKVLGCLDAYVDYSSLGHPQRSLSEPIGMTLDPRAPN